MPLIPRYITPLSYIRGTGTQYIATEIYLRSTDVVKSKWRFEGTAGNAYGCYTGTNGTDNFCLYVAAAGTNSYIRYNGELVRDFKQTSGTIYEIEHGPAGFTAGATSATFSPASFVCSAPLYIFMLANSSAAKVTARFYGLSVVRDGVVAYNFVPARNELTNEVGIWEAVNGVWYGNAGSGAFTAGPEVYFSQQQLLLARRRSLLSLASKPQDFAFVNYIENLLGTYSTTGIKPGGGGCYIDTGIYPEIDDEFEILFTPAADFYNQYVAPINEGWNNQRNFGFVLQRNATYYYMGNQKAYSSLLWEAGVPYKVVFNRTSLTQNDTNVLYYDGASSQFTAPSPSPLYLFTNKSWDSYYDALYTFKGKIYYLKYWRGGTLIHHFVPCYRKSDPTDAGFYDQITDQFHGDASGRKGFTYG